MIAPDIIPRNARPVAAERAPREEPDTVPEFGHEAEDERTRADFETELKAEDGAEPPAPQIVLAPPAAPVRLAVPVPTAEAGSATAVGPEEEPAPPGQAALSDEGIADIFAKTPKVAGDRASGPAPEVASARAAAALEPGAGLNAEPEAVETGEPPARRVEIENIARPGGTPSLQPVADTRMVMAPVDPGAVDPGAGGMIAGPARATDWQLVAGQAPRIERGAAPVIAPRDLVGQITVALGGTEEGKVEIRLDPPELGRVHIHLTQTEHGLRAMVIAERPETQELLRRNAEMLTADLGAAGYDSVHLDFASGGRDEAAEQPPGRSRNFGLDDSGPLAPEAAPARSGALRDTLDIRL